MTDDLETRLRAFAEELQERADGKRGDPSPPQRSTFALVAHWMRRDVLDQASEVHYAGRPEIQPQSECDDPDEDLDPYGVFGSTREEG